MSPTDVERESCAHCPNPKDGSEDWCTGGNLCRLEPFFTEGNLEGLQSNKFCVSSKYLVCILILDIVGSKDLSKFEVLYGQALWQSAIRFSDNDVTASAWCHGNNDFLQVDQKTMFNYSGAHIRWDKADF